MRLIWIGLACLGLAGCGKAPEDAVSDVATNAAGLAFTYSYAFRLPSAQIADAQDAHARACEQLGPSRCRITGMNYRVDDAGVASASLDVRLAAPIARSFGRRGVQTVEAAGGALTGAEIGGADAEPATAGGRRTASISAEDRTRIERELARTDLPAAERAELRGQLAAATNGVREAAVAVDEARASVETTPMSFSYVAGHGSGIGARVADAGRTLTASAATTLGVTLTLAAMVGPPALVLILLYLLWHRWGRQLWRRLLGTPALQQG